MRKVFGVGDPEIRMAITIVKSVLYQGLCRPVTYSFLQRGMLVVYDCKIGRDCIGLIFAANGIRHCLYPVALELPGAPTL